MSAIITLDLAGFTPREDEERVWTDEHGVVLSVHDFPLVPDLAAPLDEVGQLRRALARSTAAAGAGLIEASTGLVGGTPALRQLVKVPLPGRRGQAFIGSWTVPRDRCSVVLKVQAAEGPVTGMREAVIVDRVGPAAYFRPHPYDPDLTGPLPYHVGDLEEWDALFPRHPLTLVRAALARAGASAVLDDRFRALPPFPGAAASGAHDAHGAGAESGNGSGSGNGNGNGDSLSAGAAAGTERRRRWWQRRGR
ncbi:hypothetical protein KNE206_48230 [Kitasatospora sp. NE20-6]|uniref:hypothetical protein n=1 Tax=Kitasatospora sp. NE20-6 TaxID=2859066 RepID=UPI0034DB7CE3